MLLEKQRLQKQKTTAFPSNTPKMEIFLYVMPFDLTSDLKSFLQDSLIGWAAVPEETMAHWGSVSLPHWLKDSLTQDKAPYL